MDSRAACAALIPGRLHPGCYGPVTTPESTGSTVQKTMPCGGEHRYVEAALGSDETPSDTWSETTSGRLYPKQSKMSRSSS